MKLTGDQYRRICKVIVDSFSFDELRQFTQFHLDISFEQIKLPRDLEDAAFALVEWADKRNKVGLLLAKLSEDRPDRSGIENLIAAMERWTNERGDFQVPEDHMNLFSEAFAAKTAGHLIEARVLYEQVPKTSALAAAAATELYAIEMELKEVYVRRDGTVSQNVLLERSWQQALRQKVSPSRQTPWAFSAAAAIILLVSISIVFGQRFGDIWLRSLAQLQADIPSAVGLPTVTPMWIPTVTPTPTTTAAPSRTVTPLPASVATTSPVSTTTPLTTTATVPAPSATETHTPAASPSSDELQHTQ